MVSAALMQSWARTLTLLEKAIALLSPAVAHQHAADLLQLAEFIDHNELGLAFDWLVSIAEESQWDSLELLETLFLAAENMGKTDDACKIRQRIVELN